MSSRASSVSLAGSSKTLQIGRDATQQFLGFLSQFLHLLLLPLRLPLVYCIAPPTERDSPAAARCAKRVGTGTRYRGEHVRAHLIDVAKSMRWPGET